MRSMPSSRRTLASRSSTTRILAFRMSAGLTIAFIPIHLALPASCRANSSATSNVCMNSLTLIGLVRYRKNPACRPFSMSRGIAFALRATMGMCAVAGSSRRILRASIPLMPGRLMSIRITSGWLARASWIPRFPSLALSRRISGRRAMLNLRLWICRGFGSVNCKLWRRSPVQFEPEHAAQPHGALHADRASHQFNQPLAHHQADARAFLSACLLSETVERLKKLHQHVRRQSRAGVLDADANPFRGAPGAVHVHDHRSVRLVVLDRVGKKVDENLFQPGPIGIHKAGKIELGEGHFDAALLPLRLDHGLAFEHYFGQRRRFQRQRQPSGLDLREIQDFVDQLQ